MSDLRKRLASMNKKAESAISADMVQLANSISQKTGDVVYDMRKFVETFKAQADELTEMDYSEYMTLEKDFEKYLSVLEDIELYLGNFARDPGFHK